ncbi:MAG: hypothetical protein LBS61_02575 [Endomicrobium sp.]|jgi:hypothetical protein|nr:hypothetical protein [Endomicrobium sp.]
MLKKVTSMLLALALLVSPMKSAFAQDGTWDRVATVGVYAAVAGAASLCAAGSICVCVIWHMMQSSRREFNRRFIERYLKRN